MKYSKDWHLMIIVLIFIAADVIILVVAESVQASRFVPTLREDREFPRTITVCLCTVVMHGLIVFPKSVLEYIMCTHLEPLQSVNRFSKLHVCV